jgi:hypothetical protein
MAAANNDDVIFHFAGEHAASLLWIVTLQRLQNKNGNDDPKQNALAPERIENPQGARLDAKIDGVQEGFGQGQALEVVENNGAECKPQGEQREAPAALAEKESNSNPDEAAHVNPAGGMLGGAAQQVNAKKAK